MKQIAMAVRRYFMWRVIDISMRIAVPTSIPTSGEEGQKTNIYVVYFRGEDDELPFMANEMLPNGLTGKWWSKAEKKFAVECSVPYAAFDDYRLHVQHFYKGWVFNSDGILSFVWKHITSYPFLRVMADRVMQLVFNLRPLPRHDRMKVLKFILAETIKDKDWRAPSLALPCGRKPSTPLPTTRKRNGDTRTISKSSAESSI